MKKRLSLFIAAVFSVVLSTNAVAQESSSIGKLNLKAADVTSFIDNFKSISDGFDALGNTFDMSGLSQVSEVADFFDKIEGVDKVLKDNGISGPNRGKKFVTMLYGSMYIIMKAQFDSMPEQVEAAKAQGVDVYAQIAQLKDPIDPADFAVIEKQTKKIISDLQPQLQ